MVVDRGEVVAEMTTEALVPAAAEPAIATSGGGELVVPQVIVEAGPATVARFLEFFAGRIANARTRAAYGGGGRAIPQVVRGARPRAPRRLAAPRGRLHPDPPGVGSYGEAAPGRDPHARRLARRQPSPPREPRRGGAGAEARRHQGGDAGPLADGSPEAPRVDRQGRPGRAPGPGAALGDALQLRSGKRGAGDASAGLLRAGEPGLVEAPREGREAPRRSGPPSGGRGPRRLRRGGRARGGEGGALPDAGPGGAAADGPGARPAARAGDDQAARRGGGAAALDVLPHVPGDRDHGVPVERRDPRARAAFGINCGTM